MTNWKDIHPNFTEELQKEWEERGLGYEECKEWIDVGLKANDAGFCFWLKNEVKVNQKWISDYSDAALRGEYLKEKGQKKTAQEWLDLNYPKEGWIDKYDRKTERSGAREIHLTEPNLEGELDLSDFTAWLVEVYISPSVDERSIDFFDKGLKTKLTFKNLPKRAEIIPVVAQRYVNFHYPTKEAREKVEKLDISRKNLEGELDLSDFINLKGLNCSFNELTNLTLPTNPTNLKELDLRDNNFINQDLSFLVPCINLEYLDLINNKFIGSLEPLKDLTKLTSLSISNTLLAGSLDYLSKMEQLKELNISDTDLNEVQINKLPRSLKYISHSTDKRPNCKLTEVIPLLESFNKYGWCQKCQRFNTIKNWCSPCNYSQLKTNNLQVNQFFQEHFSKTTDHRQALKNIPYEQFTNIKYLAEGGFGKVYKASWKEKSKPVVLKVLHNSQNMTQEFLQEIINHKLLYKDNRIVRCHGVSQNPQTDEYVMVMDYIKDGDLRHFLKNNQLNFQNKLEQLWNIASGLKVIHGKNLVHHDFHSGNILNKSDKYSIVCYITDLGLCKPASETDQGNVYGVLSYVAPEVLNKKPYIQASDIYSFGIVAWEILSGKLPYYEYAHDAVLAVLVCEGVRPKFNIEIPQLLKDLIERCWDADSAKRPTIKEITKILNRWRNKKDTEFCKQVEKIEKEYNLVSENIRHKKVEIHSHASYASRLLNFKNLPEPQNSKEVNEKFYSGLLSINSSVYSPIQTSSIDTIELDFDIETPNSTQELNKRLRSMSMEEADQKGTKSVRLEKIKEKQEYYEEPMEIDNYNWQNINSNFTPEISHQWQNLNFAYQQVQNWINIGLQPTDYNFCVWLRDIKNLTSEEVLNHGEIQTLNQEFFNWQQEQQQLRTQQEQPPKS